MIVLVALVAAPLAHAFAPVPAVPGSRVPIALRRAAPASAALGPVARRSGFGLRMEVDQGTAMATSPAALETLKGDLMTQLSVGTGLKGAADASNRAEINELVLKLEPLNPTESAASSSLLNGVWELLYTGGYGMGFFDSPTREIALALYTGGFRPGLFANLISKLPGPLATMVEFNDVELTIKREQPRVEAAASLVVAGNEQKVKLTGQLDSPSAMRLRETLVKADFFGQSADLQGPLRTQRDLFVSFLDDDLLVVRDESGVPDIWLRKDKDFWTQESDKLESKMPETTPPEYKVDPSNPIEPGWDNEVSEDVGPSDY